MKLIWKLMILLTLPFVGKKRYRQMMTVIKADPPGKPQKIEAPKGINPEDWEKSEYAAQRALDFIQIQSTTRKRIEQPRKNTFFVLFQYKPDDRFKAYCMTVVAFAGVILIPSLLFITIMILPPFGLWQPLLALAAVAVYIGVLFKSSYGSLQEGESVTITRWGMPCRDHGNYAGSYLCFPWEKDDKKCFGDYAEIEFDLKQVCSDKVERPMNLQFTLIVRRPWAIRRIIIPKVLRLSPAEQDNPLQADGTRKQVQQALQKILSVDVGSILQVVLDSIPYVDDEAEQAGRDPMPRGRYNELVQIAFTAALEQGIFGEAIDLKRLELLIYPAKEELAAGVRKKTAGQKAEEATAVFEKFLEQGDRLFPPSQEDRERAAQLDEENRQQYQAALQKYKRDLRKFNKEKERIEQENAGKSAAEQKKTPPEPKNPQKPEKVKPHSAEAIAHAESQVAYYQQREGLAASGSGLAAGTQVKGR